MKINLKLTPKILSYFYEVGLKGNKYKFTNVLDPKEQFTTLKTTCQYDQGRLILAKDGKFLSKNQAKDVQKQYRLENWIYGRLGESNYTIFHRDSESKSFYQYLYSEEPLKLMTAITDLDLKNKVVDLLKEYRHILKPPPKLIKFDYLSKEKDGVSVLNNFAKKYTLKKYGYTYTIEAPIKYIDVLDEIKSALALHKINSPNCEYKIYEKTY